MAGATAVSELSHLECSRHGSTTGDVFGPSWSQVWLAPGIESNRLAVLSMEQHTDGMLPTRMPRLVSPPVVLRAFEEPDAGLIVSVAKDPLIPLITTVPTSGSPDDVAAYIERQHDRLAQQMGYSFAIADAGNNAPVGQIGLWTTVVRCYPLPLLGSASVR